MKEDKLIDIIGSACDKIAPAWPLENSVAVNPYLGLSNMTFETAAQMLNARGGIQMYMPISFYTQRIRNNEISKKDIRKALQKKLLNYSMHDFLEVVKSFEGLKKERPKSKSVAERCEPYNSIGYSEQMIENVSSWLALYFNKFQQQEKMSSGLFSSWKTDAKVDRHPELIGIKQFRKSVSKLPNHPKEVIDYVLDSLGLKEELIDAYLHGLLLQLVGWSSYCAGMDWQNNLYGGTKNHVTELLAILMTWEFCILQANIENADSILSQLKRDLADDHVDEYLMTQSVLQEAFDIATQRTLKNKFDAVEKSLRIESRPKAQMTFCIDVRSEVYRRNLEQVDNQIETIGFAGFFGVPLKYHPLNDQEGKNQCPVLIPSGPKVYETTDNKEDLDQVKRQKNLQATLKNTWNKFKSGTVSSFSFVSPVGLMYLPKLISDSLGWSRPIEDPKKAEFGSLISGKRKLDLSHIPFEDQLNMAHATLKGMGLTSNFAPLVLFAGHGSSSVNNPHASGLDCGACGGNSGEVNAIAAAMILNNSKVRASLSDQHDISIPEDTLFLACLHDTTTDEITIIDEKSIPKSHQQALIELKQQLTIASHKARKNRASRFENIEEHNPDKAMMKLANDWSQVRPEWGLSGCNAFVVAPRSRTKMVNLDGKAFLHSYQWDTDQDFQVLETIMTAPMIVTNWINLQYYASTADNEKLGAGNKTLHNAIGGMGVIEGARGDLRIGLPMQSIHDGKEYQHLPQKLNVVIEAPVEAINQIIKKHANVKELCDHEWITLLHMNEKGIIDYKYEKDCEWRSLTSDQKVIKEEQVKEAVGII